MLNRKDQFDHTIKAKTISNACNISTLYSKNPLKGSENLEVLSDEYKVTVCEVQSHLDYPKYDSVGDEINKAEENNQIIIQKSVKKEIPEPDDEEILSIERDSTVDTITPEGTKSMQCVDQTIISMCDREIKKEYVFLEESDLKVTDWGAEFTEIEELSSDIVKFEEVHMKSELEEVCDNLNISSSENFNDNDLEENDTVRGKYAKLSRYRFSHSILIYLKTLILKTH